MQFTDCITKRTINPDLQNLIKLCEYFEVTLNDFFDVKEE